eukprot:CAMPEP_0174734226 /NCGR_PEP_ID=MMETSP1094-20130205/62880_1 /TAXON_ID=156173 /ORGANISM="Chrysochromulina brevifilum, Strain UTEX LB 985" /LENGTH=66 /DNA_ID=CAMNT_0015937013 /DNA_START=36 /DNA_END=236 /DNA_ORIENTATION=+
MLVREEGQPIAGPTIGSPTPYRICGATQEQHTLTVLPATQTKATCQQLCTALNQYKAPDSRSPQAL